VVWSEFSISLPFRSYPTVANPANCVLYVKITFYVKKEVQLKKNKL